MLTAGVRPAAAVRSTWASNPTQSMSPAAVNGRRMADIPVIARPGRRRAIGSIGFTR
jgi:hypothetical protein